MDAMRGQFSGSDAPDKEQTEGMDATGEGGTAMMQSRDERRMQVRAYNFWAGLLGERTYPHTDALTPEALDDFGPYSVLLDFAQGFENPRIGYLGQTLAEECDLTGQTVARLADVPSRSLLSRITDHYMQILANQAPIGFEAEFVNQRGATTLYRGILLPFSRDDASIDAIYGVINWKTLSDADLAARDAATRQPGNAAPSEELPAMLRDAALLRDDAPMAEWADGPADTGFADTGFADTEFADTPAPAHPLKLPLELPMAQYGRLAPAESGVPFPDAGSDGGADTHAAPGPAPDLADWLAAAREEARVAQGCEERSHAALYAAISRSYDFALAVEGQAQAYADLLQGAGLSVQERAPFVPLVKLVFGADYDKTRISEFALALSHAQRLGVPRGGLAERLSQTPGGLKGLVRAERNLRRHEAEPANPLRARHEELLEALRQMPARSLGQLAEGGEFAVLVARRSATGELQLLGEIHDDDRLLDRAARHLLD